MGMYFDTAGPPVDEKKRRTGGEEGKEGGATAAADWPLRINFKASLRQSKALQTEKKKTQHMQHQARNSSAGEPHGATSSP